jgi:hypothetical protein
VKVEYAWVEGAPDWKIEIEETELVLPRVGDKVDFGRLGVHEVVSVTLQHREYAPCCWTLDAIKCRVRRA